jgi:hypothetical protein
VQPGHFWHTHCTKILSVGPHFDSRLCDAEVQHEHRVAGRIYTAHVSGAGLFPIALFSFAFAGELFGYWRDNAAARQA